ncbi:PIN domain-containing protein [Sulfitobacter sp. 1A15299]|uniref:PIN domain-containing protein n=1 Tax=Sulfitobacter sp. 1A15299 TaxID=3368598 RepID=UPI0037461597
MIATSASSDVGCEQNAAGSLRVRRDCHQTICGLQTAAHHGFVLGLPKLEVTWLTVRLMPHACLLGRSTHLPELTAAEIDDAISRGQITLLSIDTSIFSQYQNGLEHGLLQRLSQFEASDVDLVLSDVVVGEVYRHMVEAAVSGDKALKDAVKRSGAARNLDKAAREAIVAGVALGETPEQCVTRRWTDFQARTGYKLVVTADLVSAGDLFNAYFEVKPPFESKETKKFEFPDAMALQGLEAFAKHADKLMLVVSADGGWLNFCNQSAWLIHARELGAAMSLFQKVPSVVCAALSNQVADGKADQLHSAIENELMSFVEGMEIYPEASAAFSYEPEVEEKEYQSFEFRDGPVFKLIDHEEAEEVFVFETVVDVNISVSCSFSFQVRDEGEYISIGGAYATAEATQKMSLVVTIYGDPKAEFDVVEVEVLDHDKWVDFGYVEPDYGDDHDYD